MSLKVKPLRWLLQNGDTSDLWPLLCERSLIFIVQLRTPMWREGLFPLQGHSLGFLVTECLYSSQKTLCPSTLLRISDSVILDCQIITFNTHNRLKMHSALEPNGRLQSFIDLRFLCGYFCLHPVFFMITVSVCCEILLPPGIIRIRTYCFSHYVKNGNMIK